MNKSSGRIQKSPSDWPNTVNRNAMALRFTSSFVLITLKTAIFLSLVCTLGRGLRASFDEDSFLEAKLQIEGVQGRKPTDNDFFQIIEEFGGKLTIDEQHELFGHLLMMQKPLISSGDIFALYQAKRDSLQSGQICYEETVNSFPRQTRVLYKFAFSETGDMYLERTGKKREKDPEQSILTLADNVYTRVKFADDGRINASTTSLTEHQRYFYQSNMPLILANLFDEARFLQPRTLGRDIIQLLSIEGRAFVLEEKEQVNGRNCIVLFTPLERFYLVPEYDYAMTRFESYRSVFLEEDRDKNITERRRIGRICILTGHYPKVFFLM